MMRSQKKNFPHVNTTVIYK